MQTSKVKDPVTEGDWVNSDKFENRGPWFGEITWNSPGFEISLKFNETHKPWKPFVVFQVWRWRFSFGWLWEKKPEEGS